MSHTVSPTDLHHPSVAPNFKTVQVFALWFPNCTVFRRNTKQYFKCRILLLKFKSDLLMKISCFFLNAALAMTILDLISRGHRTSLLPRCPSSLEISHFLIVVDVSQSVLLTVVLRYIWRCGNEYRFVDKKLMSSESDCVNILSFAAWQR